MMRHRTPARDAELRAINDTMLSKDICAKFGLTTQNLSLWRQELGLMPQMQNRSSWGRPPVQPSIFPEADDRLRELCSQGLVGVQIAAELGVTKKTIYRRMAELDLVSPGKRGQPEEAEAEANRTAVQTLWREGLTASMIATRLGWTMGKTNGIYARLKASGADLSRPDGVTKPERKTPLKASSLAVYACRARAAKTGAAARKPSNVVVLREPPAPRERAPIPLTRAGTCCFPIGEPGTREFRFCEAAEVVAGKPYCPTHCARAYVDRPLREVRYAA